MKDITLSKKNFIQIALHASRFKEDRLENQVIKSCYRVVGKRRAEGPICYVMYLPYPNVLFTELM